MAWAGNFMAHRAMDAVLPGSGILADCWDVYQVGEAGYRLYSATTTAGIAYGARDFAYHAYNARDIAYNAYNA
jgi:hypothetical protein